MCPAICRMKPPKRCAADSRSAGNWLSGSPKFARFSFGHKAQAYSTRWKSLMRVWAVAAIRLARDSFLRSHGLHCAIARAETCESDWLAGHAALRARAPDRPSPAQDEDTKPRLRHPTRDKRI